MIDDLSGGFRARDSYLPLSTPCIGEEEKREVMRVLESGWLSTGPRVKQFEQELTSSGRMNRGMDAAIGTMLGRVASVRFKTSAMKMGAVDVGRFQVLDVDRDVPIKQFVQDNGLTFKKGRGFYEFTKTVEVQEYKEVILEHRETGDLFTGDKAREIAGIPVGVRAKVKPNAPGLADYVCFIQSTSVNRKLIGGTRFLYEVDGWAERAAAEAEELATV